MAEEVTHETRPFIWLKTDGPSPLILNLVQVTAVHQITLTKSAEPDPAESLSVRMSDGATYDFRGTGARQILKQLASMGTWGGLPAEEVMDSWTDGQ